MNAELLERPTRAAIGPMVIAAEYVPSDGRKRVISGKRFGREFRVYAVYGDVTNAETLKEMAQEIAIEHDVDNVVFKF